MKPALKAWRKQRAAAIQKPAFVVFSNKVRQRAVGSSELKIRYAAANKITSEPLGDSDCSSSSCQERSSCRWVGSSKPNIRRCFSNYPFHLHPRGDIRLGPQRCLRAAAWIYRRTSVDQRNGPAEGCRIWGMACTIYRLSERTKFQCLGPPRGSYHATTLSAARL